MTINILIGIGGSGAKIVESALFLLSAGIGPAPRLIVGLVDQDNSNGNVVRTLRLLSTLQALRADFGPGKANRIDWTKTEAEGGCSLFSIEPEPLLGPGKAHWRPAPDNTPTLRHIMRHQDMAEDEKALFDLLFRDESAAPGNQEQTMDLGEGYRGRAHVGASALVAALHHDQPEFLASLTEHMQKSAGGEEVRIFIAGSLFGGTGAAGFPTIARSLNNLRAQGNTARVKGDNVRIGGVLMLPYFSFSNPADNSANVLTTAQLLPQARVAIEYYERLLQQEGVFDRLYVTGWDELFDMKYHEPGRGEQRNPALLPELVAALGAMDFFTSKTVERETAPLVAARREKNVFGWDDLPAHPDLKKTLYHRLGAALRFAVWWHYRVEPAIDDRGWRGIKIDWLRKQASDTDWQKDTPAARENVTSYVKALLEWASSMRMFGKDIVPNFALWNPESLEAATRPATPANPVDLHISRSEDQTRNDIDEILHASDSIDPPVGAQRLYDDLFLPLATGESKGLGRLVAAVHRAAQPFRKQN